MKNVIVVLGMHRSGTSTVAGLISLMGYGIGKEPVPALDENPKGFFENNIICGFNQDLLARLQVNWFSTYFLPHNWYKREDFSTELKKLHKIFDQQFSELDHIVLKDPRMCVLLPLYLDFFRQRDINPFFVLAHRSSQAIASSLSKRNSFTVEKSHLLWLDHIIKAERYTRNQPRLFVSYEKIIEAPESFLSAFCEKAGLPAPSVEALKLSGEFVDKSLNHFAPAPATNSGMPGYDFSAINNLLHQTHLADLHEEKAPVFNAAANGLQKLVSTLNTYPTLPKLDLTVSNATEKLSFQADKLKLGANHIAFDIQPGFNAKLFSIQMHDQPPAFLITKSTYTTSSGREHPIIWDRGRHCKKLDDGLLVLENDYPAVEASLFFSLKISHIQIEIEILGLKEIQT